MSSNTYTPGRGTGTWVLIHILQVEVQVPEPVQDCGPRKVVLPSIECEDITEEK